LSAKKITRLLYGQNNTDVLANNIRTTRTQNQGKMVCVVSLMNAVRLEEMLKDLKPKVLKLPETAGVKNNLPNYV